MSSMDRGVDNHFWDRVARSLSSEAGAGEAGMSSRGNPRMMLMKKRVTAAAAMQMGHNGDDNDGVEEERKPSPPCVLNFPCSGEYQMDGGCKKRKRGTNGACRIRPSHHPGEEVVSHQKQKRGGEDLVPKTNKIRKKIEKKAMMKSQLTSFRSILESWMNNFGRDFDATEEVCSLAISIYSRFLLKKHNTERLSDLYGIAIRRPDLATCLWVSIKLEEDQTNVPNSVEVACVTGVADPATLIWKEEEIGNILGWRLLEGHVAKFLDDETCWKVL